ncbi:hypothetical protein GH714_036747 [Hevea brasiliensis]|uniref:Uncharacterized protein n=1 Tax=Hevea brasiliensis TaxID=3981 RepID=A0A6A6M3H7_HEVBR|nr:hypothetical protein GH714_036747 [Hevea brasiliensis]
MAEVSDKAQCNSSLVEKMAGAKCKGLAKSMGPSRMREEFGDVKNMLARILRHLINEESRVDKVEDRLAELGGDMEESHEELQATLKETINKLTSERASKSEGSVRENFHSPSENRRGVRIVLRCYRCKGPHKKRNCPKKAVFVAKGKEPEQSSAPLEPASEGSLPCGSLGAMSLVGPSEVPSMDAVDGCGTQVQSKLPKKLPPEEEVGCVSEPTAGSPSEVVLPKQERPRQPRSRRGGKVQGQESGVVT